MDSERFTRHAAIVAWEKVKKEVIRLGGTVEGGCVGRWWRFNLNAPAGYIWNATGDTTSLVVEWRAGDMRHRRDAASDALERVRLGISKGDCKCGTAEHCPIHGSESF